MNIDFQALKDKLGSDLPEEKLRELLERARLELERTKHEDPERYLEFMEMLYASAKEIDQMPRKD